MSKYPEYNHQKSRAWFNRALDVIPSGIYGHLGPSEGLFLPLEKWPLLSSRAKGTYFWDMDGNQYLDLMCAYGPQCAGLRRSGRGPGRHGAAHDRQLHHRPLL